jgi:hypothetical protein
VVHPKKPWTKPEIRHFDKIEELLAYYREGLSETDFQKLMKLAEQLNRSARRSPGSLPVRKSAKR